MQTNLKYSDKNNNLKFNLFSFKSGFTLVEIMIAVSMLAGISLALMQLNKSATKVTAKTQFDTDVLLTTNEINGILSDPNKCLTTFTNATQASLPSTPVLNATPANVLTPSGISGIPSTNKKFTTSGGPYGNSAISITGYSLDLSKTPDPLLTITFQKKVIAGPGTITKTIPLFVETNSSGIITLCRSISTSTVDIWSHGTGTNIFYSGGVQVGDETQATLCDASTEGTLRYHKVMHAMQFCGYKAGPPASYLWKRFDNPTINLIPDPPKVHGVNDGGGGWADNCPNGYFMTGVGVGGNVMSTYCAKLATDGTFNFISSNPFPQTKGVNDGGSGWSDNCSSGFFMTGISVGGNVMRTYCSSISNDYLFTFSPASPNPKTKSVNDGGGGWGDTCAAGSVMTGFSVGGNSMTLNCAKFQLQ